MTTRAYIKKVIPAVPMKIILETLDDRRETFTITRESVVGTTWMGGWTGNLERNENGKVMFYADR